MMGPPYLPGAGALEGELVLQQGQITNLSLSKVLPEYSVYYVFEHVQLLKLYLL